jgi:hypothetical protein
VCPIVHTYNKNRIFLKQGMEKSTLQINESAINETFASINNIFDEFRMFTSSLFLQILDWITSISENVLK